MVGNSKRLALVFPGQGAQYVGMGRDLYEGSPAARLVFDTVDKALGFSLTGLCFEGPEEVLTNTYNAQPAILTHSVAALAALEEKLTESGLSLTPAFTAGHSLGEFSALIAAGALTLQDGAHLVRERGRLMRDADQQSPGGMAAIIGLQDDEVEQVVRDASARGIVRTANFNCPGQVVITGAEEALVEAMSLAKDRGAKRVVRLAVSIASHSPLMRPAAIEFTKVVRSTTMTDVRIPVVGNVTATALSSADEIRHELAEQLCSSVLWTQSVRFMVDQGVTEFVELGPGNTLTGLIRRIDKSVAGQSLSDMKSIEAFIAARKNAEQNN